jgi:AbrB family looped-hinge helix DNA binding protein
VYAAVTPTYPCKKRKGGAPSVLVLLGRTSGELKLNVMNVKERQTRVNQNGRIVIPASFRRALGLRPGETVFLRVENDELRLATVRRRLAKARRLIQQYVGPTVSLVDELIARRREDARPESDSHA